MKIYLGLATMEPFKILKKDMLKFRKPLKLTLNIMMLLVFLDPTSKSLVACVQAPQLVLPYLSYVQTKKTKSVLGERSCSMHVHMRKHLC